MSATKTTAKTTREAKNRASDTRTPVLDDARRVAEDDAAEGANDLQRAGDAAAEREEKARTKQARKSGINTDIFDNTLTINFSNGKELSVTLGDLDPEIVKQAALHGLKQKLVDAAAIARDTETGRPATIEDKYDAIATVHARLTRAEAPSWNAPREGNGGGAAAGGVFLRAVMAITGLDHAGAKAKLDGMTKEQVAALKKNPRVMAKMHEIQLAEAAADSTSDELLAALTTTRRATDPAIAEVLRK